MSYATGEELLADPSGYTIHSNRLIAFLDVLGLSGRLDRDGLAQVHAAYAPLVDQIQHTIFEQGYSAAVNARNCELVQFVSDSLILVSLPIEDVANVCKFILSITLLLETSLNAGLPMRGAVGRGDVLDDLGRGVLLSNAFARLYRAEHSQRWAGCYVLKEAESYVVNSVFGDRGVADPLTAAWPLLPFAVPHKGPVTTPDIRWCFNWVYMNDTDQIDLSLARLNQDKREATELFVRYVRALPDPTRVLAPEYLPARGLRRMVTRGGGRVKPVDARGNGVALGLDDYGDEFSERPE